MKRVDQLLEDAALVESVYDAQGKRHPNRMRSVNEKVIVIALAGQLKGRRVKNGASSGIRNW
jgi:hypothetical protein